MRNSCEQVPASLRRAASELCALGQAFVEQDDNDDDGTNDGITVKRLRDAGKSLSARMKNAGKKNARALPGAEATQATPQKVLVSPRPLRLRVVADSHQGVGLFGGGSSSGNDSTNRLLLQAIRTMAEVTAQAVRILFAPLSHMLIFLGWHSTPGLAGGSLGGLGSFRQRVDSL
jgi:hypothetical protein